MMPRLRPPRLLPITIVALAGLLAVKSSELVRAATGSADAATQTASAVQAVPAIHQPAPPPVHHNLPRPNRPRAPSRRLSRMPNAPCCWNCASVGRNWIHARRRSARANRC